MTESTNLLSRELQRFSENSSRLLLDKNKLADFFRSVGHAATPVLEGELGKEQLRGYKVLCPVCRQSACFVGMNGKVHKIFWHCYSKTCPSQSMKPRNLISFVRRLREDDSLREAIFTISKYLGYRRSYDITNGKFGPTQDAGAMETQSFDENNLPF